MASADPRHFCFRCNDYAHFNYECPKLNATLSTAERRRQFADTDPSASARDSQRRNTKLSAMEKIRADCATIPSNLILQEVEQLINIFRELQPRAENLKRDVYSLDSDVCGEVLRRSTDMQDEVRVYLERVRLVMAAGIKKLETFESNFLEKQIFSAKLQDLKQLRESIWLTVTQRKDISRNVLLTVNEFNSLDQKINGWVDEFLQYMDSHSQYTLIIPNYQSIDEQIVERTTELNVLKSRATYLQNQAGLGLFAEHRIGVAERRLGEAKHRRQLQEFRQFTCPKCLQNKIEALFTCGHGCCIACRQLMQGQCFVCENRNLWCIPIAKN